METLSGSSSLTTTFQFPKQSKATSRHPQLNHPFSNNHPSSAANSASSSSLSSTLHQKDTFTPLNLFHNQKHPSSTSTTFLPPPPPSPSPLPPSHDRVVHRKAATGYAAALVEVSQREGRVYMVERDARRLLKLLKNGHLREFMMDEVVEEYEKGQVVKQLLEKGKFDKNFVALVKLVVDKANNNSTVGLVKDVLHQFLNIFSHLSAATNTNTNPKLA